MVEGGGAWSPDPRYPEAYRRDLRNLVTLAKTNGVRSVLTAPSIAVTQETDFARGKPKYITNLTPDIGSLPHQFYCGVIIAFQMKTTSQAV